MQKLKFLSEKLFNEYAEKKPPMTELGEFVYLRTYSRWIEEEKRREKWVETIARVVEYSLSLEEQHIIKNGGTITKEKLSRMQKEANELFKRMFHLQLFSSGRTMWVANTPIAWEYPLANYNCAFRIIDSFDAYVEMFYLLMLGAGVGFRTMPEDIEKLPSYKTNIKVEMKPYRPLKKEERLERSKMVLKYDPNHPRYRHYIEIIVGDSKEGWTESLKMFFDILTQENEKFNKVEAILFNFDSVRPKGEKLKRFGGRASGHEAIKRMFSKIDKVMKLAGGKLRPIHALDIGNIIAENVVSGGVRRSSQINLASVDDEEIENAKNRLYIQNENNEFVLNEEISHRRLSNNSIFYMKKPTREQLRKNLENMRYTGERGIINVQSALKRRKAFQGVNPCSEILLANWGVCNLVTNNMVGYVENGKLLMKELLESFRLTTRIAIRMTLPELELENWNKTQREEPVIGVSLTGWFDMVDMVGLNVDEQTELLKKLRATVHEEAKRYSKELGIKEPVLKTTIKPEGTISQLPTVSEGVHRSHSAYYIRRVRVTYTDPIAQTAIQMGYPVYPETGETWENVNTVVVEFPVKSPVRVTKFDVTAIEQLETYKMFQRHYTDHNTSITVTVREHEWEDVEQWIWDNWDEFIGISFLPLNDAVYPLAPYEAISEEEYLERKKNMKPLNVDILNQFESGEDYEVIDEECANGACPVR